MKNNLNNLDTANQSISDDKQDDAEMITISVVNNLKQDIELEVNKEIFLKQIIEDLDTIANEYLAEDVTIEFFSIVALYDTVKKDFSFINYMIGYYILEDETAIIGAVRVDGAEGVLAPYGIMSEDITLPLVPNEIIQSFQAFGTIIENYTFNADNVVLNIAPKINSNIYTMLLDSANFNIIKDMSIIEERIAKQSNNESLNEIQSITFEINEGSTYNDEQSNYNYIYEEEQNNDDYTSSNEKNNNYSNTVEEYLAPLISIRDSHNSTYNQDYGYITIDINDYAYNDEVTVLVNGNQAARGYRTSYSYSYDLTPGTNTFDISVANKYGKVTNKNYIINFEPSQPKVSITKQGNSYGFFDNSGMVPDYNKLENLTLSITCNGKVGNITDNKFYDVSEQEEEGENTVVLTATNKYGKTYVTSYTYTK